MTAPDAKAFSPTGERWTQLGVLLIASVMLTVLPLLGRVWWCEAGDVRPWSWDVWSRHNSQHLVDPYSLSHIQHGIGLSLLLAALFGRNTAATFRTLVVVTVEGVWEIAENTDWMIQRYREATISLDYYGDSILNSLADYGMCLIGLWVARRFPPGLSVALFVCLEIVSVLWIRDSLLLNVLMLIYPIDAVRHWQMG